MTDDLDASLGVASFPVVDVGEEPMRLFEDRLLKGAHLRVERGSEPSGKGGFHVRVEDLLNDTGRRGEPRR